MNVIEAREAWLRSPHRHDFGADIEGALEDAFAAGWNAARPAIYGTGQGATHNAAKQLGGLKITIWGHTEDGQTMALVYDEDSIRGLVADLERCDMLRRHQ